MENNDIGFLVKHLNILIGKQFAQKLESRQTGYTRTQIQVIAYLMDHPDEPVQQRDLEHVLNLSRPTINGIVKRLSAKGAVHLVPGEEDRRLKRLVLSDKAKKEADAHRDSFKQDVQFIEDQLTAGMTQDQVTQLKHSLRQCIENMQK